VATEVAQHYENLLAEHYTWTLGADFDELVTQQRELLDSVHAGHADGSGVALDLGCGSGIHSIALAQLGHETVLGVDFSSRLLAELATRCASYPAVRPVHADITEAFESIVEPGTVETVVCMGDTVTHLPDTESVQELLGATFRALAPGGRFVLSFRDLTVPLRGLDRFLPVHADENRIMTCFLEEDGEAVRVHDLLHHRTPEGSWELRKSSYRKIRLAPAWVASRLSEEGFTVDRPTVGPRRMQVISARRPTAFERA
jgi:SAM-dependent methyltransferase